MLATENLTIEAQAKVAHLTHEALRLSILDEPPPAPETYHPLLRQHPYLAQPLGAFLTIYVRHELRGCLGEIEPRDSVLQLLLRLARRVPRSDYRFDPTTPDEIADLSFKISILSPLVLVDALDEIQLGRDGLYVRHHGLSGLLLPEVPQEFGWDRDDFLVNLWRKARIPGNVAWNEAQLYRFTTQTLEG